MPVSGLFTLVLSGVAAATLGPPEPRQERASGTVVFVCEHGTAKSLIAREWFNRLAAQRGIAARAVSRGVNTLKALQQEEHRR